MHYEKIPLPAWGIWTDGSLPVSAGPLSGRVQTRKALETAHTVEGSGPDIFFKI
jgi:hypothetical protein